MLPRNPTGLFELDHSHAALPDRTRSPAIADASEGGLRPDAARSQTFLWTSLGGNGVAVMNYVGLIDVLEAL
jgi:hypothetical protein